jgi:alkylation response protein AidB-like acyl-CoA dehydrogenase
MDAETLALFEDGLERFTRERYGAAQMVEKATARQEAVHWWEMAKLGWFELAASESGLPEIVPLLSIYRAAGQGLWREPIGCVFGEAAVVAAHAADAAVRQMLCAGLTSGEAPLAFAAREAGQGCDGGMVSTVARPTDRGVEVSGQKVAVPHDAHCRAYLVMAVHGQTGKRAYFLVERAARGLDVARYHTVEGRELADLRLDRTPAQFVCNADPELPTRAWGTLLAAAECVGIMNGALHDTVSYLRQRKQFGRPLIDFQVLQHRLADMQMRVRETDALLRELGEDLDAGQPLDARALLALSAQTSRAAREVTRDAVQMHGGMGVTRECRVSHYYRRVLTVESLYGGESWALERLAEDGIRTG